MAKRPLDNRDSSRPELKRSLGLWQVTASGVGIVIGAGIYVLVGAAAADAGNALWVSFILAAALSALTGLSYAELAGMFPTAGAEYAFARAAFNPFAGFMAGWVMIVGNVIAAGAVAIGFGHYFRYFFDVDGRIAAVGLLACLTLLIWSGIQKSILLSVVLVVLQVLGLVLVIVAGAPHIGDRDLLEGATFAGVLSAAALVFFAFIGFDEVVTLSEETRDASRVIPRALLLALAISTVLYVLVGVAAVSVAGAEKLAASETPLTEVIAHDWGGRASSIVAVLALASTTNTSLLVLTAASRLIFSLARDGFFPKAFSRIGRGAAPSAAAGVAFVGAACLALLNDIHLVASITDFAVFVIFLIVDFSLIALRFSRPDSPRTFKVPLSAGRLPLIPCVALVVTAVLLASLSLEAWLLGSAALLAGLLVWLVSDRLSRRRPAASAG